jgi:hypothetical protein
MSEAQAEATDRAKPFEFGKVWTAPGFDVPTLASLSSQYGEMGGHAVCHECDEVDLRQSRLTLVQLPLPIIRSKFQRLLSFGFQRCLIVNEFLDLR